MSASSLEIGPPTPSHFLCCPPAWARPVHCMSTLCPIHSRSVSPSQLHPQTREEREGREVTGQSFHLSFTKLPRGFWNFFATPRVQRKSDARSRNIVKFGRLWLPFKWLTLRIFTFFRTFPLQIPRLLRLLHALCHSEHLLLSSRHPVCY